MKLLLVTNFAAFTQPALCAETTPVTIEDRWECFEVEQDKPEAGLKHFVTGITTNSFFSSAYDHANAGYFGLPVQASLMGFEKKLGVPITALGKIALHVASYAIGYKIADYFAKKAIKGKKKTICGRRVLGKPTSGVYPG